MTRVLLVVVMVVVEGMLVVLLSENLSDERCIQSTTTCIGHQERTAIVPRAEGSGCDGRMMEAR